MNEIANTFSSIGQQTKPRAKCRRAGKNKVNIIELSMLLLLILCNSCVERKDNVDGKINKITLDNDGIEYKNSTVIDTIVDNNVLLYLSRKIDLVYLSVNGIKNISIPNFLEGLKPCINLKYLVFNEAVGFNYIPKEIILLPNLEVLKTVDTINRINENFYKLQEIKELDFYCTVKNPKFSKFNKIRVMRVSNPYSKKLPYYYTELLSLETISLHPQIEKLVDLKKLSRLGLIKAFGSKVERRLSQFKNDSIKREQYYNQLYDQLPPNCEIRFVR